MNFLLRKYTTFTNPVMSFVQRSNSTIYTYNNKYLNCTNSNLGLTKSSFTSKNINNYGLLNTSTPSNNLISSNNLNSIHRFQSYCQKPQTLQSATPVQPANSTTTTTTTGKRPLSTAIHKLIKTNISLLVTATAAAGYVMACPIDQFDWGTFIFLNLGTFMTSTSANIFNQDIESNHDAKMKRTKNRPIVTGEISSDSAFKAGIGSMALGGALLLGTGNMMVLGLGIGNIMLYVCYTYLKRVTPWNTWVGALVGAIPPVMGTYAATGCLEQNGIFLGTTLFLWQIPHFLAISDSIKPQYQEAGYKMLSVTNPTWSKPLSILHSAAGIILPWVAYAYEFGDVHWISTTSISFMFTSLLIPFFLPESRARRIIYATSLVSLCFVLLFLGIFRQPFEYIPL